MRNDTFEWLNRHVSVSRETFERLSVYHDLLLKWQSKINLVSTETVSSAWERHFLDSLQLISHLADKNKSIVDMGTGAGFPGMVLAISGYNNVHLVESDGKKIIFLREVARLTKTNVTIHHDRIENITGKFDVIVSRALSDLNQLLNLSSHLVSHGTFSLFHKGKNYSNEIEDAKLHWSFDHEIYNSVTDNNGVIIKLSTVNRRAL